MGVFSRIFEPSIHLNLLEYKNKVPADPIGSDVRVSNFSENRDRDLVSRWNVSTITIR